MGIDDLIQKVLTGAIIDLCGLKSLLSSLNGTGIGQSLCEVGVDSGYSAEGSQDDQNDTEDDDRQGPQHQLKPDVH